MSKTESRDELLSVGVAASLLNVSQSTLRRMIKRGELSAERTEGGHRRLRNADVARLASKRSVQQVHLAAETLAQSQMRNVGELSIVLPEGQMTFEDLVAANPNLDVGTLRTVWPTVLKINQTVSHLGGMQHIRKLADSAFRYYTPATESVAAAIVKAARPAIDMGRLIDKSRFGLARIDVFGAQGSTRAIKALTEDLLRTASLITPKVPELQSLLAPIMESYRRTWAVLPPDQLFAPFKDFFATNRMTLGRTLASISATLDTAGTIKRLIGAIDLTEALPHVTDERDMRTALVERGWVVPPYIPRELKRKLRDMHQDGNLNAASNTIVGYFRRDDWAALEEMVEAWAALPFFSERMSIFQEALTAHRGGLYRAAVSTLMPQIEGILTEYIVANGLAPQFKNSGDRRRFFGSGKNKAKQAVGDLDEYDIVTWWSVDALHLLLTRNLYDAGTDFEDLVQRRLPHRRCVNRHTVLHGLATGYGRRCDAVQQFLILDTMTWLRDIRSCLDEEGADTE